MRLHVPGAGETVPAHESQHVPLARSRSLVRALRYFARMKQAEVLARHKAVVDEEGLFDPDPRVAALEVAGAIVA